MIKITLFLISFSFTTFLFGKENIHEEKQALLESERNTIDVFNSNSSKVVNITTTQYARVSYFSYDVTEVPAGSGSGFLWGDDGHIVTNYHVIRGADKLTVAFGDGSTFSAKKIGQEPKKDIAVLKIDDLGGKKAKGLSVANSTKIHVGQKAIAIGSPFGFDQTLTTGIVSGVGRSIVGVARVTIKDMIQTDASINPGNSGGPLLNSRGDLIGMNTMIFSKSGGSSGVGFAVPSNTITRVVNQLIKFGKVKQPGFGVEGFPDSVNRQLGLKGFIIRSVSPGSEAEKANLQGTKVDRYRNIILGDIIVEVSGKKINNYDDLYNELEDRKIGSSVEIKILRSNKYINVKVKLMDISQVE